MKTGTRSLLFGTKSLLIRTIFSIIAWRKLYGKIKSIETFITICIQFIGFWNKPINSDTEIENIKIVGKITNKFKGGRTIKILFGTRMNEAAKMILKSIENGKWEVLEISESFSKEKKDFVTTKITLLSLKDDSAWTKMINGSNKKRSEHKMVPLSELFYVNELSIQMMPKWLIKLLTYLSDDPEGKKELKRRKNESNNKIKNTGEPST